MLSISQKMRRRASWVAVLAFLYIVLTAPRPQGHAAAYEALELLGFALAIVAALGRVWCTLYIGGRKDKELCQDGPYSLSRNPLYFFSFLGAMGIACASQVLWIVPVVGILFAWYYVLVIRSEERNLGRKFGEAFAAYRADVPMFVPRLGGFVSREVLQIEPRFAMRAISDASWFLWALVAMEAIEFAKEQGLIAALFAQGGA
jgi:protein-S-isoprenylcysteine O-methyltransferase Ste14